MATVCLFLVLAISPDQHEVLMDVRGCSIGDAGAMALASALQTGNYTALTSLNLFGAAVCALWRIVLMCYILIVWLAQANQQLKKRAFLLDIMKEKL